MEGLESKDSQSPIEVPLAMIIIVTIVHRLYSCIEIIILQPYIDYLIIIISCIQIR